MNRERLEQRENECGCGNRKCDHGNCPSCNPHYECHGDYETHADPSDFDPHTSPAPWRDEYGNIVRPEDM